MPPEVFAALIRQLTKYQINRIRIGGGEPTLHPDLFPMLKELSTKTRFLNVITNAQWRDSYMAQKLISSGADLIEISIDALASRAAKLSKIELVDPGTVIGRSTPHSMQAGVVYGFAGQVDGIVNKMREELGGHAVSVATGGLACLVFEHAHSLDHLDNMLTLKGLELIYRRSQEGR